MWGYWNDVYCGDGGCKDRCCRDTGMMYVVGMDAVRIDDVGVAAVEIDNVRTDVLVNYTIERLWPSF